tara:strand:+ start:109 stop:234 length:126 start_codon:yes stop_codon:yes gene_type:complete
MNDFEVKDLYMQVQQMKADLESVTNKLNHCCDKCGCGEQEE